MSLTPDPAPSRSPFNLGGPAAPRYLVATFGTTGDVHPFMAMALALKARGRQVTLLSNSVHAALVQSAGLDFVGLGTDEEYRRILEDPRVWDPRHGFAALLAEFGRYTLDLADALRVAAHSGAGRVRPVTGAGAGAEGGDPPATVAGPCVVLAHPFALPAAAMARSAGHVDRVVAGWLAPSNLKSCADPLHIGPVAVPRWVPLSWRQRYWRFIERGWIDPVAVTQVNVARAARGLGPISGFLDHLAEVPDLSLSLFPPGFAATAPDWPRPMIEGGFPLFDPAEASGSALPPEVQAFLAGGPPPIVFTAGTGNLQAAAFYRAAAGAVVRLGPPGVFLCRERRLLPEGLPPGVLWAPYVPLSALLPHAAAFVHHGGIGSTAEALRAGLPQLVVPFGWDQFDNAARLRALGVARSLPAWRVGAWGMTRALRGLLDGTAATRAAAWAGAAFPPDLAPAQARQAWCGAIERALGVLPGPVAAGG